jgi:two-component system, cell cycle sensor histidine kinase and response regulator CckA
LLGIRGLLTIPEKCMSKGDQGTWGQNASARKTGAVKPDQTGGLLEKAYNDLNKSQAELNSIFRAAPIGIGIVIDRVIAEVNDTLCAMVGYRREELIGQSARTLYPTQEEYERVGREKYAEISEKGIGTIETVWRTKDGRDLSVLLSSAPLDRLEWHNGVTFTALDITEHRRADEALRLSEDKFARAFNASPDAIIITRVDDGRIIEANQGFTNMTGYAREEALGKTTLNLKLWTNSKCRDEYAGDVAKNGEVHDREYDFRTKTASILNCTVSGQLIPLGDEPHMLSIIRDITERKRAEQTRLEIERRMLHSQKLESLGVLAGGIAHDFNNLLMAIIGNLDLALLELDSEAPSREFIEQALHATRRAGDLTRQMLAYSGKGRFILEGIDLSALILEDVNLIHASVAKTATLNLNVPQDLSLVRADPGQVQQVIMNMITNASEAIGDRPGVITVTAGEQAFDEAYLSRSRIEQKPAPGRFVFVEVTDTGCGMDPDTLHRLFEPFFTTKFTGRGLGMAAVLGIVRGHQGAILVDSEKGRGTGIRVLFPVAEFIHVAQSIESVVAGLPPGPVTISGTVLIVDDEEPVRDLCSTYVARFGLKTLLAADGKEAVEMFTRHVGEIALVILDLNMPAMDGLSTFHELKRVKPETPVILCSGYDEQEATQNFFGEGLAAFIQKPYHLQDLKQKIEQVMHSSVGP